ncbi:MAG: ABC transporter substrate-binding protein [Patescibacteria group bacterium]|jgi:NitT/TauT family transport system substrate-binding protein
MKNMQKTYVKWIVGFAILVILVGIVTISARQPKATDNGLQRIKVAEFGELFLYAPMYVAQEKGFFKEQGLDVEIFPTGGDEKTFAALLSNEAQFGVADPTFVAISGEKGQPGKIIAPIVQGVPFWGVAKAQRDVQIKQPSDLGSYKVATFPSPSTAYTLQKNMFVSGGLKPNIQETAFGSLLAALAADKVDIALELEPNVSLAVKNGDKIAYRLADYYPQFALTGLSVLPDYLGKHPDVAQKMVNALGKSFAFIRENPEETAKILHKRFPEVDEDVALSAVKNLVDANVFPKQTVLEKAGWDAAIQLRRDVGDLKGDAPYEKYVVTDFAQKYESSK